MIEIRFVHPEKVPFISSKSVEYLKSAHNKFFGDFNILERALNSEGTIYEVCMNDEIIGCFFIRFLHNHLGRIMEMYSLGGKLSLFADELSQFLWKLAVSERVDEFIYMGRDGFSKIFPWLKKMAAVYRCSRSDLTQNEEFVKFMGNSKVKEC